MKFFIPFLFLLTGCTTFNQPFPYYAPAVVECPNQATAYYRMLTEWINSKDGVMLDCSGFSMPLAWGYGFAENKPFEKVEVGDVAVFIGERCKTAHVVIGVSDKGLMTKGINNAMPDEWLVTRKNYLGVLTKMYVW